MLLNFSGQFLRAKPISSQISDQNEVRGLILYGLNFNIKNLRKKLAIQPFFKRILDRKFANLYTGNRTCSVVLEVQCSAVFADFYTFSDPARQWPKRTLITVFDSTWPDRPNRLEYQFFPPKSLKFSYDPSLSGAVQLQAGDIFKAESSADPGNSSDGMSW